MASKQESVVEWLLEQMDVDTDWVKEEVEQAKAMENEQKIKAQIEILKSIGDNGQNAPLYGILKTTLIELNKQLKSE